MLLTESFKYRFDQKKIISLYGDSIMGKTLDERTKICTNQGKVYMHGFDMPAVCLPKPNAASGLNDAQRRQIRGMSKTACNDNPKTYWREETRIHYHCVAPHKVPPLQATLFKDWNDKVYEQVDACSPVKGMTINKALQTKYCRIGANYVRQSKLGRSTIGKINHLAATHGKSESGKVQNILDKKIMNAKGVRYPTVTWIDSKLLYDQRLAMKAARKAGRAFAEKDLTALRQNKALVTQATNVLKREGLLK
jgi:hypothetical protein